jgi:hypothetical protein
MKRLVLSVKRFALSVKRLPRQLRVPWPLWVYSLREQSVESSWKWGLWTCGWFLG